MFEDFFTTITIDTKDWRREGSSVRWNYFQPTDVDGPAVVSLAGMDDADFERSDRSGVLLAKRAWESGAFGLLLRTTAPKGSRPPTMEVTVWQRGGGKDSGTTKGDNVEAWQRGGGYRASPESPAATKKEPATSTKKEPPASTKKVEPTKAETSASESRPTKKRKK